jgi:threonine synthase
MGDIWLECIKCHAKKEFQAFFRGCDECATPDERSPVEIRYANRPLTLQPDLSQRGVWRWSAWLPPLRSKQSLEEGATPLLKLHNGLSIKNETRNPTWSWKDRPNAVTLAAARHFGYSNIAVISTGNHGVAAAAYSAIHNVNCTIYCHEHAPLLCCRLMERFGATVIRSCYDETAFRAEVVQGTLFPGTTLDASYQCSNPFGIEGFKTIAFEIIEQRQGAVPSRVYVPTGSGDGIAGIWKGFRELLDSGIISTAPKMIACQAEGAASLTKAFNDRLAVVPTLISTPTNALSIAERRTGQHALRAVQDSFGSVQTASDQEGIAAASKLARFGIAVELSSAIAYACALKDQLLEPSEFHDWVIIGSGAITKWPSDLHIQLRDSNV